MLARYNRSKLMVDASQGVPLTHFFMRASNGLVYRVTATEADVWNFEQIDSAEFEDAIFMVASNGDLKKATLQAIPNPPDPDDIVWLISAP